MPQTPVAVKKQLKYKKKEAHKERELQQGAANLDRVVGSSAHGDTYRMDSPAALLVWFTLLGSAVLTDPRQAKIDAPLPGGNSTRAEKGGHKPSKNSTASFSRDKVALTAAVQVQATSSSRVTIASTQSCAANIGAGFAHGKVQANSLPVISQHSESRSATDQASSFSTVRSVSNLVLGSAMVFGTSIMAGQRSGTNLPRVGTLLGTVGMFTSVASVNPSPLKSDAPPSCESSQDNVCVAEPDLLSFDAFNLRFNAKETRGVLFTDPVQSGKKLISEVMAHFTSDQTLDQHALFKDFLKDKGPDFQNDPNYAEKLVDEARKLYEIGTAAKQYKKRLNEVLQNYDANKLFKEVEDYINDDKNGIAAAHKTNNYIMGNPKTRAQDTFDVVCEWLTSNTVTTVACGVRDGGQVEEPVKKAPTNSKTNTSPIPFLPARIALYLLLPKIDPGLLVLLFDRNEVSRGGNKESLDAPMVIRKDKSTELLKKLNLPINNEILSGITNTADSNLYRGLLMGIAREDIGTQSAGTELPPKTIRNCDIVDEGATDIYHRVFKKAEPPKKKEKPPRDFGRREQAKVAKASVVEPPPTESASEKAAELRVTDPTLTPYCTFINKVIGKSWGLSTAKDNRSSLRV